jgi:hypothetical protein
MVCKQEKSIDNVIDFKRFFAGSFCGKQLPILFLLQQPWRTTTHTSLVVDLVRLP